MALLGDPELLLLDECFAALDVMTIKMLQQIIVNLQFENQITICICDHQARDLLTCVDVAMVLSEGKVIAKGTPNELVKNQSARTAYFGTLLSLINLDGKNNYSEKIKKFNKTIRVDGDKSLSIRSLLIGSQSYGFVR